MQIISSIKQSYYKISWAIFCPELHYWEKFGKGKSFNMTVSNSKREIFSKKGIKFEAFI